MTSNSDVSLPDSLTIPVGEAAIAAYEATPLTTDAVTDARNAGAAALIALARVRADTPPDEWDDLVAALAQAGGDQ